MRSRRHCRQCLRHHDELATLVSVVDALGATDWIEGLSPPPGFGPIALLELQQAQQDQQPKRASGRGA